MIVTETPNLGPKMIQLRPRARKEEEQKKLGGGGGVGRGGGEEGREDEDVVVKRVDVVALS